MELHQLRYFVAAAETGSMSRAAERCHVAQPSLSQQVRKLERTLGETLFDRLGRGVALTDAGRALLPRARRILADVREARRSLRADVDAGSGPFCLGAIPTMAPYLLPAALNTLRAEFRACEITVVEDLTERLVQGIVDNEIDCAVMSAPVEHDLIDLVVVGSEPMLVVAPAGHQLAAEPCVSLSALRDLPAITLHEMHCLGRQIRDFCTLRKLARNVVCRSTQLATVLEFVRLGLGVSVVPEMAAKADGHPDRRFVHFKGPAPRREIAIARRRDRSPRLVGQRFADIIRAQLSS